MFIIDPQPAQSPLPDCLLLRPPTMAQLADTLYAPLDSPADESASTPVERVIIPVTIEGGYDRLTALFESIPLPDLKDLRALLDEAIEEREATHGDTPQDVPTRITILPAEPLSFSDALTNPAISAAETKAIGNKTVLDLVTSTPQPVRPFEPAPLLEAHHD